MSDRLRELMFAIKYKRSALDNVEIRRLYTVEGLPLTQIADRFGCSHSAIGRRLAAMEIERRPFRRPSVERCFCGKPALKIINAKGHLAGTRCKFHRQLARAQACRNFVRRKRQIPPERWRVASELRDHQSIERPVYGGAIADVARGSLAIPQETIRTGRADA